MKIVQVIGTLQIGGAENQATQLLNGISAKKAKKYLVIFQELPTVNGLKPKNDVDCITLRLDRRGQLGLVNRLSKVFLRIRPDVVQSHMFHNNLYTVLAARIAGVPITITTEHGKNLWKNNIHHLIERRLISPLATMRVAVSRDILDIRVQTRDVPSRKIVVIPPCVSVPVQGVEYKQRNPVRIGAVGRMVSAKDYPTLLEAFLKVLREGLPAELLFLGDGPERPRLEELADNLGVRNQVRFLGFKTNVQSWLRKFDLIAFSSVREGIPVAMLEAMAAGVPVVATRAGGIPEVIRDGVEGLLVDCRQPSLLASALLKMGRDLGLRRKIGSEGRKRIISDYSRETICLQYLRLYQLLLRQGDNFGR